MLNKFLFELVLLLCCIGLSTTGALAQEEEATLFPVPNYSGDLYSRPALTGDWGGKRTELAEKGIQFAINLTQSFQDIADGGVEEQDDYQGTADYYVLFDSTKSGLWPGGFIELHAESYWGESVIGTDGALLPSNMSPVMNAPAGNGTYLTHFVVTQFLSERFAVTAGKINTATGDANDFAHGIGRDGFMNSSFSLNPVTFYASPYAPLGGGVIYLLGEKKQHLFAAMAWDTDAEIDKVDFDSLFEGNTTYASELRLRTNFFGKKGHQSFGIIYGDGDFTSLEQDTRISFDRTGIDITIVRPVEDETWAFFYNFDQYLVINPNNPEQGWGIFG